MKVILIIALLALAGCEDSNRVQSNDWNNAEVICANHGGAVKVWRRRAFSGYVDLKVICKNNAVFEVSQSGWATPDKPKGREGT